MVQQELAKHRYISFKMLRTHMFYFHARTPFNFYIMISAIFLTTSQYKVSVNEERVGGFMHLEVLIVLIYDSVGNCI